MDHATDVRWLEVATGPAAPDLVRNCELIARPTLRRLVHAVLEHQDGPPADDATLMLVQWSAEAALETVPKAAQEGNS
jgi:hypothetical protein